MEVAWSTPSRPPLVTLAHTTTGSRCWSCHRQVKRLTTSTPIAIVVQVMVQLVASINARCVHKYSVRKLICNCIHRFICEKRNRTNVANVPKHSLIQVIYLNIHGYISVLNLIDVKYVSASLHNCLIYSSTFGRTQEINRTSAVIQDVTRLSLSCQIYSHIRGVTKLTSLSSVTVATSAL